MNTQLSMELIFPAKKPKVKQEWYIRARGGDGWHFLWKTHANGGGQWAHDFELTINGGKKKPLRYKTYNNAKASVQRHLNNDAIWEVVEWKDH